MASAGILERRNSKTDGSIPYVTLTLPKVCLSYVYVHTCT